MLLFLLAFGDCDDLIECSWDDTFEFIQITICFNLLKFLSRQFVLFFVSFSLHVFLTAHDGICFSTTGLPVGKNGAVVALQGVFYDWECAFLVDFLLGGLVL